MLVGGVHVVDPNPLGILAHRATRTAGWRTAYRVRVPSPPWFRHDAHLAHDVPGHPERPERIRALEAEMSARGWFGCERIEAPAAGRELIEAVHAEASVTALEEMCARGGARIDADTIALPGTWEAAVRLSLIHI